MHIAVACGGTGGHVFPGLSVARALRARGHRVTLWLAGGTMEGGSIGGWDGPVETVRAFGFPTGLNPRSMRAAFALAAALLVCRRRMRRDRPEAVLAMGSYASVGPVLAARSLSVPSVLHEANAVPGRAVSFLSRFSDAVAVSFESARRFFPGRRVELTGFPVRNDLEGSFDPGVIRDDHFRLLAMGGSQGARRLNVLVPEAAARARDRGVPLQVIHLSGPVDEGEVRSFYQSRGVPHIVFGFLREIGKAYRAANFAIARSGAGACAELAACGVPALLVPLPASRRDHQVANARDLESAGAADVLLEKDATVDTVADRIELAFRDCGRTAAMRSAMLGKAHAGAAEKIAAVVEQVAGLRASTGR
jgi:UDP-N-acetylglucosamine--N-acetylmuramyl-(pentapeptide) pyrophosphoryl-undecaprenol N-acetylglucosamine transferase